MKDDNDEILLFEADFEIIRNLTKKVDLLDINLNKLISNNNVFIEGMLKINEINDSDKNKEIIEIENKCENNEISEKNIKQIKKICKKCKKQIFKKYDFCYKHCQDENIIPQNVKRKDYDNYVKQIKTNN
jgi:hypothetical protein